MAKIAISSSRPTDSKEAIIFLHKRLGIALSSAAKRLKLGEAGMFYTTELYHNDHCEKDAEIMDIVNTFSQLKIPLTVYVLDEGMSWYDIDNLDDWKEPQDYLVNVLNECRADFCSDD